jgi:hypothetical protein
VSGTVRCRTCGALAAEGVEWCQQCYAPLPTSAPAAAPPVDVATAPAPTPPAAEPDPQPAPEARSPTDGTGVAVPPMPVPPRAPRDLDGVPTVPASLPGTRPEGERAPAGDGHTPAFLLKQLWDLPTVPEPAVRGGFPAGAFEDPPEREPAAQEEEVRRLASLFSDDPQPPKSPATWPCAVCGTANDLERDTCSACMAPFAKLFETKSRPRVAPRTATARSLMFPGLGHAAAGKPVEGVARGILFLWCAATGAALIAGHPAGGLGVLLPIAALFLVVALGFYAVTALDAARLAAGDRQLVSPKSLLYGTAALMGLSIVSLFFVITRTGHVP